MCVAVVSQYVTIDSKPTCLGASRFTVVWNSHVMIKKVKTSTLGILGLSNASQFLCAKDEISARREPVVTWSRVLEGRSDKPTII